MTDERQVECRDAEEEMVTALIEMMAQEVENLNFVLPLHDSRELNEATDDAACDVLLQAAAKIRSLKPQPPKEEKP
jgi:hypothetical protein